MHAISGAAILGAIASTPVATAQGCEPACCGPLPIPIPTIVLTLAAFSVAILALATAAAVAATALLLGSATLIRPR